MACQVALRLKHWHGDGHRNYEGSIGLFPAALVSPKILGPAAVKTLTQQLATGGATAVQSVILPGACAVESAAA